MELAFAESETHVGYVFDDIRSEQKRRRYAGLIYDQSNLPTDRVSSMTAGTLKVLTRSKRKFLFKVNSDSDLKNWREQNRDKTDRQYRQTENRERQKEGRAKLKDIFNRERERKQRASELLYEAVVSSRRKIVFESETNHACKASEKGTHQSAD